MFYSHELLSRRGRLGVLWLAGHLHRVSKHAVLQANISELCEQVENPPVALALPVQSTLLAGVIHIENKKAVYLWDDAAQVKTEVHEIHRMKNTGDANKIKARSEAITLEDTFAPYEAVAPFDADTDARGFETTQDRMAIDLSLQAAVYARRATISTARVEDVTLNSWSFDSQLAGDSFDLNLTQDELGGAPFDLDEPMLQFDQEMPSIVQEVEQMPEEHMETEAEIAAVAAEVAAQADRLRRQAKKRGFKVQIDSMAELEDTFIRAALSNTSDIVRPRHGLALPIVAEWSLADALNFPSAFDIRDQRTGPELTTAFEAQRIEPVVVSAVLEVPREEEYYQPPVITDDWGPEPRANESMADIDAAIGRAEPTYVEYEPQVQASEIDGALSLRSYLGHALDTSAIEQERAARDSMAMLEQSRRESNFGISTSFLTPRTSVSSQDFSLPLVVEGAGAPATTIGYSPITAMFLNEVEAKFDEQETRGEEQVVEFDELLQEVVGSKRISRRDRALSFFAMLMLGSAGILEMEQHVPNGEIEMRKSIHFSHTASQSESF